MRKNVIYYNAHVVLWLRQKLIEIVQFEDL